MGIEVFMPLILLLLTEGAKALMRYYRLEPPPSLTPSVAVVSGAGLMSLPTFHTLPSAGWWMWPALGVVFGFAAFGLHQAWGLLHGPVKRRRRVTDRR